MKLTCVTATFNCIKAGNRDRLIRCVESVAKLKTEHEHLIYDGASTDGTAELLSELEKKTPGLKVVSEPDTGIYNALNKGVRDAKGEWFYVLGADDYIFYPEVLDSIIDEVQSDDGIDAIVTTVRKQTSSGEEEWFTDMSQLNHIFVGPCVCHQGELLRTVVVRKLGGFDEQYRIAADSDMLLKAHMMGIRFKYIFESFAYFSYGGAAVCNLELAMREHRLSVANVLGLNDAETQKFVYVQHLLPMGLLVKLVNHSDVCIRQSARRMVRTWLRLLLRIPLYPLVWATRPIRHSRKRI